MSPFPRKTAVSRLALGRKRRTMVAGSLVVGKMGMMGMKGTVVRGSARVRFKFAVEMVTIVWWWVSFLALQAAKKEKETRSLNCFVS